MNQKTVMDQALKFLSQKSYTRNKLTARLLKMGFKEEDILECLNRLSGWGYLDDREFALSKIKSLIAKMKSKNYIQYYLMEQGLSLPLIAELLEEHYSAELEVAVARKLLEQKKASSHGQKKAEWALLARAGFSEETIGRCFGDISPT